MEKQEFDWGFEIVLWKDKNFTVKLIHIDWDCELELHKHLYKRELIIDESLNTYLIEPNQMHTLACDKKKNFSEFIEVSKRENKLDYLKIDFK